MSKSKKRKASHIEQDPSEDTHMRLELDSHADTCAFNPSGCLVVNETGDVVTVEPFTSQLGDLQEVPICTVAIAYDDPSTGHTYILFFHQSLVIDTINPHLVNPFQVRDHGVTVNATPLQQLDTERTVNEHSILFLDPDLAIPLTLDGIMSGLTGRKPSWDEVNDHEQVNCTHVQATGEAPWEPSNPRYHQTEEALRNDLKQEYDLRVKGNRFVSPLRVSTVLHDDDDSSVSSDGEEDDWIEIEPEITDCSMQPRRPSRKIQSVETMKSQQYAGEALDLDSFAEALLADDGIEMMSTSSKLAAATTVKKR